MASTNKTAYLNLNQWIASDPILRTDFNFDNSRIDAAVNARALVRLTGGSLTAAASQISVDLADYDLTQYMELQLYVSPVTSASATATLGLDNAAVTLGSLTAEGVQGLIVHLCLLPGGVGGFWFAPGASGTSSGTFRVTSVTAADLTSLTLACGSAAFQSGTGWALYGV
ncbi:MAG: hypothetical protein ACI3VS_03075, partial [Evtepia sp.]